MTPLSAACAKAALQVPLPQRLVSHAQKQILFVKGYFQVRKMSTSQTNSICGDACQATCDAHCHAHHYTMHRSKAVYRRAKQQLTKPARACSWDGSSTAHRNGTAQDVCRETCQVELRHAVVPRTLTDAPAGGVRDQGWNSSRRGANRESSIPWHPLKVFSPPDSCPRY